MLKKTRLTSGDFKKFRPQKKLHGSFFSLSVGAPSHSRAKFSAIVSKKVSAKAVERNLVKRRMRAIMARVVPRLSPANYVLAAKAESKHAAYKELENDIKKLAARL